MKPMAGTRLALLFVAVLVVSGAACSHNIQPAPTADNGPPVAAVALDPDAYAGERIVWGGSILHARSGESGMEVRVLEAPLDRSGVPGSTLDSEGKFIARLGIKPPDEMLLPGRFVTIAGEVKGKEREVTGNVESLVPVVQAREIRVWKASRRIPPKPEQDLNWFWRDTPYPFDGPSSMFFPFH